MDNDKTENMCYKMLKIEQIGEKLHVIWDLLYRIRFFTIRNGCQRLLNIFMEYENSIIGPEGSIIVKNLQGGSTIFCDWIRWGSTIIFDYVYQGGHEFFFAH